MQRFFSFLLVISSLITTVFAEDYFGKIKNIREEADGVAARVSGIQPNGVSDTIAEALQGVQNRLGAAQTELLLLTCMGWLLDFGSDNELFENPDFEDFWETFVGKLSELINGAVDAATFKTWFFQYADSFLVTPIPNLERVRFHAAFNALVNNVLVADPQANARVIRYPRDVEAFFDSHYIHFTTPVGTYQRLIRSVARSLFNLTVEIAHVAIQDATMGVLYQEILAITTELYALLGEYVPRPESIQLSPRTLQELNADNTGDVQLPSPRNGPLSPRENFGVPERNNMEDIPLLVIPGAPQLHLSASTGSMLDLGL